MGPPDTSFSKNRVLRALCNWSPPVIGAVAYCLTPAWVWTLALNAFLIAFAVIMPGMAHSYVSYCLLAESGKTSVLAGVQTSVVMAFFLALPTIVKSLIATSTPS